MIDKYRQEQTANVIKNSDEQTFTGVPSLYSSMKKKDARPIVRREIPKQEEVKVVEIKQTKYEKSKPKELKNTTSIYAARKPSKELVSEEKQLAKAAPKTKVVEKPAGGLSGTLKPKSSKPLVTKPIETKPAANQSNGVSKTAIRGQTDDSNAKFSSSIYARPSQARTRAI